MSQKRLRNKCQKKTREAHYYSIPHIAQFSMRNFSVLLGLLVDPLKKIRFIRILHIFTLMNLGLWFRIEIRAPIWICELAIVEINLTSHSICNQGKKWNPKSFFFPSNFRQLLSQTLEEMKAESNLLCQPIQREPYKLVVMNWWSYIISLIEISIVRKYHEPIHSTWVRIGFGQISHGRI